MTNACRRAVPVVLAVLLAGCSPEYVLRAGWEEAKILSARRPIAEILEDPSVDPATRAKLGLVRDARVYGERILGLEAGKSFTSYAEIDSDTLVLVVSAAPELALRWKTWWFPIVGDLPYKGFFHFDDAREEAEKLRREGWDVWVRSSSAFSTLGWLPDPILSTSLREDSVGLAETVFHEMTHTTFFPSGRARFNESFANFVGWRGAIEFFCDGIADDERCAAAESRWHDVRVFGRFFHSVHDPLDLLYAGDLPAEEKRARKAAILEAAAARFNEEVRAELRSGRYGALDPASLNNAWLLSRVLYYSRLDDFETLYGRYGDLAETIRALIAESGGGDPWRALDRLLAADATRAEVADAR